MSKNNRKRGFIPNPFTKKDKKDFTTKRIANNITSSEEGYKSHLFFAKALAMLGLVELKQEIA